MKPKVRVDGAQWSGNVKEVLARNATAASSDEANRARVERDGGGLRVPRQVKEETPSRETSATSDDQAPEFKGDFINVAGAAANDWTPAPLPLADENNRAPPFAAAKADAGFKAGNPNAHASRIGDDPSPSAQRESAPAPDQLERASPQGTSSDMPGDLHAPLPSTVPRVRVKALLEDERGRHAAILEVDGAGTFVCHESDKISLQNFAAGSFLEIRSITSSFVVFGINGHGKDYIVQ